MLRTVQAPSRAEIFYPVASHDSEEHLTGCNFINGFPIFRRTFLVAGGNGASSVTIADLANVLQFLVTASWTALDFDDGKFLFMRAGSINGLEVTQATGFVEVFHQTINLTNEFLVVTLEYTKLGGNP